MSTVHHKQHNAQVSAKEKRRKPESEQQTSHLKSCFKKFCDESEVPDLETDEVEVEAEVEPEEEDLEEGCSSQAQSVNKEQTSGASNEKRSKKVVEPMGPCVEATGPDTSNVQMVPSKENWVAYIWQLANAPSSTTVSDEAVVQLLSNVQEEKDLVEGVSQLYLRIIKAWIHRIKDTKIMKEIEKEMKALSTKADNCKTEADKAKKYLVEKRRELEQLEQDVKATETKLENVSTKRKSVEEALANVSKKRRLQQRAIMEGGMKNFESFFEKLDLFVKPGMR